jgi:hypothetical protein
METVAEEKPLAAATSRMVTVELLLLWRFKSGSPVGTIILPMRSGMQETPGGAAGLD